MAARDNNFPLLASTSISSSGNSDVRAGMSATKDLFGMLSCTAVPTGGAPTLDVYLQTTPDGGTTWQDIAHYQFTTSTANRFFSICGSAAGSTATVAASDAQLSGDTVRQGPWGDQLRLKWVFAAGGSTGAYTLSASAVGKSEI
jgi:hypothetical protein